MKAKHIIAVLGMTMILALAGCGSKGSVVEVTPTPAATPTPTEVPVTVTPVPTSTPAPKVIGVKTSQAKYIYLTNSLQKPDSVRIFCKSGRTGADVLHSRFFFRIRQQ